MNRAFEHFDSYENAERFAPLRFDLRPFACVILVAQSL
jgi:hypothetical protein